MRGRHVAPKPRLRRVATIWFTALATTFAVIITQLPAVAVHTFDLMELDRNAIDDFAGEDPDADLDGADWDTVVSDPRPIATSFKQDPPTAAGADNVFTIGGSKDDLDMTEWSWKLGNTPAKDDLTNAYAAAFTDGTDTVLYFGADRFANNGDSQIGFWFLQDDVVLMDGKFKRYDPGTATYVLASHTVGDILVLSDFTGGGRISTITVYQWVGSGGDTNGTLQEVTAGADCVDQSSSIVEVVCGTVNTVSTAAPWSFTPKFADRTWPGGGDHFPRGSFYEGGIVLNQLGLPVSVGCVSSFLVETRSSQSVDAQLKDFVLDGFDLCEIDIEKTGPPLSKVGDEVTYTYTITNPGGLPLYLDSIVDDRIGDLESYAPGSCDLLLPDATCEFSVPWLVPEDAEDPYENTVTVVYRDRIEAGVPYGAIVTATASHTVELFQPAFEVAKTGDPLSKVGDEVTYTFTVTNLSSGDAPVLELVSMDDTLLGDLEAVAVAAGCGSLGFEDSCTFDVARFVLGADADPLTNTVTVVMSPAEFPNLLTETASHTVELFQPAFEVAKTGDPLSKVGDEVTYTFTVTNLSSGDAPVLELVSMDDTLLGDLEAVAVAAGCGSLGFEDSCTFDVARFVLGADADPLTNTVTVVMSPAEFPNLLTETASHTVELFQPAYTLSCATDPAEVFVGDSVCYLFTVTNTSSDDAPDLVLVSANDTLLGDVSAAFTAAGAGVLGTGESTGVMIYRTVPATDPDLIVNALTTVYQPAGFDNLLTRTAGCEVTVLRGCALSPGFWGGGSGVPKWDQPLDPVALAAGFTTGTEFPWLAPSLDGSTYLEVLKLQARGDVTRQLAFKYIAATLNEAAPLIGVSSDVSALLVDIELYFGVNPVGSDPTGGAYDQGRALKTALDSYFSTVGELGCPNPDDIPEYDG